MENITEKQCKRCKQFKSLEYFKSKHRKKTLASYCTECIIKKSEILSKNRELFKEGLKICSKCEIEKEVSEFRCSKAGLNNLENECKICCYLYDKEKRLNNLELIAEKARIRRDLKKEYYSQYEKRFRNEYHKSLKGYAFKLFSGAKGRAKKKNLEFNLTSQWVLEKLTPLICEATGFTIDIAAGGVYKTHPLQPTLDRVDSAKGYTMDNVKVTCWWWNVMKQDWTEEIVKELIKKYKQKNE